MSLFLSVLVVVLKILLGLLLVFFLLLLLVLFTPIRFCVDARLDRIDFDKLKLLPETFRKSEEMQEDMNSDESDGIQKILEGIHFNAFVHWILYLVRARAAFHEEIAQSTPSSNQAEPYISLKILFFTLIPHEVKRKHTDSKKRKKVQKEPNRERSAKEQDYRNQSGDEPDQVIEQVNSSEHTKTMSQASLKKEQILKAQQPAQQETTVDHEIQQEKEQVSIFSFFFFLWRVFDFLISFVNKPYAVFQKFLYTISSICDKISLVRDLSETDTFERAKTVLLKQTKRLLRGLSPKKCDINIAYGAGEPYLTAQLMAIYSVLHPLFRGHVVVTPYFENKMLEAELHLKGRITVFKIVTCFAIVYFNKDLRKVIRRWNYIKGLK